MRPTVLVVDDETHIQEVLALKLRQAGYAVLTAGDGEEGLQLARENRPALVITDFRMPYMTGLELGSALAADARTQDIPVLMLTARGHSIDPADLSTGNIREVQSKPFSPRAILRLVERLVGPGGDPKSAEAA